MKKNILVIDDSALMRRVICDIINSDEKFQVIDTCNDGLQAYEKLRNEQYDAVLMDMYMPRMGGLQLLERLQKEEISVPIVAVSTATTADADITVRAMELGAVDFVTKPQNIIEAKGMDFRRRLLRILTAVLDTEGLKIQLRTTTHTYAATGSPASTVGMPKASVSSADTSKAPDLLSRLDVFPKRSGNRLVALACSTGGPKALHTVIPMLEPGMDAPMVVVQHMPEGFTNSLAERLNEISRVSVKEAQEGEILQKGSVYIAPGGKHLEIVNGSNHTHKVHLSDAPAIGGLKPCANVMYESLMDSRYDEITCVVLTGMGADGMSGIGQLKSSKPIHVIAQNAQTCVVYGMPRAVAEAGLVDEVVSLESVANTIMKNVGVK